MFLSRGEPEELPLNSAVPSAKAKYIQKTDSAEYREGKVKSTERIRVKQNLKPVTYKRSEPKDLGDGVPFA